MRHISYEDFSTYRDFEIVVKPTFFEEFEGRYSNNQDDLLELIDFIQDGIDSLIEHGIQHGIQYEDKFVFSRSGDKFRVYVTFLAEKKFAINVYKPELFPQKITGINALEVSDGKWSILSTKAIGKLTEKSKETRIIVEEGDGFIHTFENGDHITNFVLVRV